MGGSSAIGVENHFVIPAKACGDVATEADFDATQLEAVVLSIVVVVLEVEDVTELDLTCDGEQEATVSAADIEVAAVVATGHAVSHQAGAGVRISEDFADEGFDFFGATLIEPIRVILAFELSHLLAELSDFRTKGFVGIGNTGEAHRHSAAHSKGKLASIHGPSPNK